MIACVFLIMQKEAAGAVLVRSGAVVCLYICPRYMIVYEVGIAREWTG